MIDYRRVAQMTGPWSEHAPLLQRITGLHGKCAADYHDVVAEALEREGWVVRREFPVVFSGENGGRVDIVADRNGKRIALELDNHVPRGRSILKLQTFPANVACAVLLRDPK